MKRSAVVLWGALALVVLSGASSIACGGGTRDQELQQARQQGAKEARDQARLNQLSQQIKQLKKNQGRQYTAPPSPVSDASGPVSSCGYGVQVGSNTTCAFALNVAGEYGSNPGASSIQAYSPATNQYYTMSCYPWSGGGTVCEGGNNASVYLP